MQTFVTGGTGFVGQWLVKRLLEENHTVYILVRNPKSLSLKHKNLHIIKGDVTNPESLDQIPLSLDVTFHLAGVVGYSKADRQIMEDVNVQGTQNIVNICLKKNVKKLIHMSSVTAVGASFDGQTPLNEESSYNIKHLDLGYFETKRKAEEIVMKACQQNKLNATLLNPSTIYGPGDAEKGSRSVQLKVAKGQFPFYTSGGVSIIGVNDVVDCLLAAIEKGKIGERYILSGENITIKYLLETIADLSGQKRPHIYLPNFLLFLLGILGNIVSAFGKKFPMNSENAKTSTLFHWFDSKKAQQELGLKPQKAEVYLKQSIDWVLENKL